VTTRLHHDDPALLIQAIEFTASETGFNPRLIEKDYLCTVVLEYLGANAPGLIFKGGTCLSKVYGDLYRLSEDLDFSISMTVNSTRTERSRRARKFKQAIVRLPDHVAGVRMLEAVHGANNSTQYNARLGYESLIDGHIEGLSIEIGLREPAVRATHVGSARTVLLNPVTGKPAVDPPRVECLSHDEAMAEKLRAAMCRRDVAIRDYFDVDHAVSAGRFDPLERSFLMLLRRKLEVPMTSPVDVSDDRTKALQRQLQTQLRAVLRQQDFVGFDLDRAVATVRGVAEAVADP
jgi:predicted nucleotidyltransferase component of viral defense system